MAFLPPEEPTSEEEQLALSEALRRQQGVGLLAMLSGSKRLGPIGQALVSSAHQGQQVQEQAKGRRFSAALQAKRDQAEGDYRNQQLGLQGEQLELQRQRDSRERFQMMTGADPETGKPAVFSFDPRTGKARPTGVDAIPKGDGGLGGEKFKDSLLEKLGTDLDPHKGGSSLAGLAQATVNAAERVETLLNSPGPMTTQRVHELTVMAATVAAGGHQPTESQVKGMYQKTFSGELADWAQFVTSKPKDAGVQAFMKQTAEQSEREKVTAKAQIKRAFLSKLSHHSSAFQKYPQEAHRIAKFAGLEGLYNPETLEPLQTIDPVAEAGKLGHGETNSQPTPGAPAAASGPHGPVVKQNGVEYPWNPKTGRYE